MFKQLRIRNRRIALFLGVVLSFGAWLLWGPWPDPAIKNLAWKPDVILILGGGDNARVRQGRLLAERYPDVPLLVTGDGGDIVKELLKQGASASRITHEQKANSTYENGAFTIPLLARMHARRVVIVTNWFHVPRALAVFRHEQPTLEFEASFEIKPNPLSRWDRWAQQRERMASVLYLIRYGIWSW